MNSKILAVVRWPLLIAFWGSGLMLVTTPFFLAHDVFGWGFIASTLFGFAVTMLTAGLGNIAAAVWLVIRGSTFDAAILGTFVVSSSCLLGLAALDAWRGERARKASSREVGGGQDSGTNARGASRPKVRPKVRAAPHGRHLSRGTFFDGDRRRVERALEELTRRNEPREPPQSLRLSSPGPHQAWRGGNIPAEVMPPVPTSAEAMRTPTVEWVSASVSVDLGENTPATPEADMQDS